MSVNERIQGCDMLVNHVHLVVEPLKNMDLIVFRIQYCFLHRLFGYIRRIFRR